MNETVIFVGIALLVVSNFLSFRLGKGSADADLRRDNAKLKKALNTLQENYVALGKWAKRASDRLTDHDKRLKALEKKP